MLVQIGQIDGFNTNVNSLISSFVVGSYLPLTGGTLTGNLTAPTFIGALQGNATTATRLQTARTIALSGAATGTATSFNGSANITIPVTGLNASNLNTGTVPTARLGSGTASSSTVLYGNNTWGTIPVAVDTITRLRGTTSGTLVSGDITLLAGSNTTITQSGNNITIASANTNTTYSAGTGITLSGTTFSHTAHTGDVTGSTALTIANNAVTFTKMQNIATQRLLGRGTAGTGNIEELTIGTGLSLSTTGVLSATGSGGTVTSITAGNGMNFTTISGTGAVTLGTPSTITLTSTNSITSTSHTHALSEDVVTAINNGNTAFGWGNHSGLYALVGRSIIAGNGLSGGGTLAANRTITLGTPTAIGLSTTNSVATSSHTHALDSATTTAINNGQTAFGWGNHALAGYLISVPDSFVTKDNISSSALTTTIIDFDATGNGASILYAGSSSTNRPSVTGLAGGLLIRGNHSSVGEYQLYLARGEDDALLYRNQSGVWNRAASREWSAGRFALSSQLSSYVPTSRTITAGNGLSGGGNLTANRTITLGTPGAITLSSTNSVGTSSHTHAFTPGGTTAQYIRGDGSLATFPSVGSGSVTSVGMTIAGAALNVSGSPITTSGTLALTWSGATTQYVRGDGSLATIPTNHVTTSRSITAGNGLSGGGTLAANRTITLGTPSAIGLTSTSSVTSTSHTHALDSATTTAINNGQTAFGWGNYRDYGLGNITARTIDQLGGSNNDWNTLSFGINGFVFGNNTSLNYPGAANEYPIGIKIGYNTNIGATILVGRGNVPELRFRPDNSSNSYPWARVWHDVNLPNPATETWVNSQNFLTSADLSGYVPTGRTITAGDGLTGGGNLTANRTISVDGTVVRTSGNQSITGNKEFSNGFFGGIETSYGNLSSLVSGGTSAGDMLTGLRIINKGTSAGTKARVLFTLSSSAAWENVSLEADRFGGSSMRFNIGIGNGTNSPTNIAQFYSDRAEINGNLILGQQGTTTTQAVRADRTITAGNGLSGGGNLTANRTITLGTPGDITLVSTSSVGTSSHTHAFNPGGTTAQYIRGNGTLATFPTISDTTYSAGTGLSLSGTTFGQAITTSGTGTYVQSITQTASGFQVNLGTPPNNNTTYSAGTVALLTAGTNTTNRVWRADYLNQGIKALTYHPGNLTFGSGLTYNSSTGTLTATADSIFAYSTQGGLYTTNWSSNALGLRAIAIGNASNSTAPDATSIGSAVFTGGFGSVNVGYSSNVSKSLSGNFGIYNSSYFRENFTYGIGLQPMTTMQTVIGRYNQPLGNRRIEDWGDPSNPLFILGVGEDAVNRKNSVAAFSDGRLDYMKDRDTTYWNDNTIPDIKWINDNVGGGGGGTGGSNYIGMSHLTQYGSDLANGLVIHPSLVYSPGLQDSEKVLLLYGLNWDMGMYSGEVLAETSFITQLAVSTNVGDILVAQGTLVVGHDKASNGGDMSQLCYIVHKGSNSYELNWYNQGEVRTLIDNTNIWVVLVGQRYMDKDRTYFNMNPQIL